MDIMEEIWKNIEGYPNYMVSNLGRVKSLNYNGTGKEKVLKPQKINKGYLFVCLYKDKNRKQYFIHRLVAQAFIPNPNNLPECNHKDENPLNNILSNLEWCDHKYNINYGTARERISEKHKGKHLSEEHKENLSKTLTNRSDQSKVVIQYDLDGNFIREFPSTQEVQRQLGYNHYAISACCRGKYKTAYGYLWRYV